MPEMDPHSQHCCAVHGCRFNNNDRCSVFKGQVLQLRKCGETSICSEYRVSDIREFDDFIYDQ